MYSPTEPTGPASSAEPTRPTLIAPPKRESDGEMMSNLLRLFRALRDVEQEKEDAEEYLHGGGGGYGDRLVFHDLCKTMTHEKAAKSLDASHVNQIKKCTAHIKQLQKEIQEAMGKFVCECTRCDYGGPELSTEAELIAFLIEREQKRQSQADEMRRKRASKKHKADVSL